MKLTCMVFYSNCYVSKKYQVTPEISSKLGSITVQMRVCASKTMCHVI